MASLVASIADGRDPGADDHRMSGFETQGVDADRVDLAFTQVRVSFATLSAEVAQDLERWVVVHESSNSGL